VSNALHRARAIRAALVNHHMHALKFWFVASGPITGGVSEVGYLVSNTVSSALRGNLVIKRLVQGLTLVLPNTVGINT
jgi:hypothetical protein